jgi:PAS domain-containing protein
MWAMDAVSFRFIVANEDAARLFGYTREVLLLLTMYDVLAPEERGRFDATFGTRNLGGDAGEWACRWPDDSRFRVRFRHYESVLEGNLVTLAWAVKITGHLVLNAPLLPDIRGCQMSDDSRVQSSWYD